MLFEQLKKLMGVENKSAGTKAKIKSVVEQLNEIVPDLGLAYDEETDKLNKATKSIKKNIEAMKEQSKTKAYQSGIYAAPVTGEELKALINLDNIITSNEFTELQEKGMQIPQYLAQGISDGSISFANAVSQLSNLMNFQDAIIKAGAEGVEIPAALAESVAQGKITVDEAVNQLLSGGSVSTPQDTGVVKQVNGVMQQVTDNANKLADATSVPLPPVDSSGYTQSLNNVASDTNAAVGEVEKGTADMESASNLSLADNSSESEKSFSSVPKVAEEKAAETKTAVKKNGGSSF